MHKPAAQSDESFVCTVEPHRQSIRVRPEGELDMATAPVVDRRLIELRDAGFESLVVDLRGLTFMDSSGVHLLVDWTNRCAADGATFAVIDGGAAVQRVLEVTGVRPSLRFLESALAVRR